jgi:hypothetical protein
MIWNMSAFEPAISDRNIHLNEFDNPLSAPPPVLILFYVSCLPCSQMICCIGLVCLDRVITRSTCVLGWLPVLDVIQRFHRDARSAARYIMREEVLKT